MIDIDRALINLDIEVAKQYLAEFGQKPSNELAVLAALHKTRYERPSIPRGYRHASRAWLEQHGLHRWRGMPWPPAGELPE